MFCGLLMKPKKLLSGSQERTLARRYVQGATIRSLAKQYGCSDGTIQAALDRRMVPRRSRKDTAASRKALTPEKEQALVAAYLVGASLEALGEQFGCSPVTARNTLVRLGVPRRKCGRQAKPVTRTKVCSSCERDLPRSEFYGRGHRSSECKECVRTKQTDKYWTDPDFRRGRLEAERRRRSGWSSGNFERVWQEQRGRCAICLVPMRRKGWAKNSVHADHDHSTGHTRGLLCDSCNRGLGCFKDSPEALHSAIQYLESHAEYQ